MRVISGIAKGRNLKAPRGLKTRPTTDRVKEALFNILGQTMQGSSFLDLFAGTGAIGIEALSRGAESLVLVEKGPQALRVIKENLELTGLGNNAKVINKDVYIAMETLQSEQYDYIFMDPPYLKEHEGKVLCIIDRLSLLKDNGIVVIERSKLDTLPLQVGRIKLYREEKYGDTVLSFYHYAT